MVGTFTADLDKFIAKSKRLTKAVVQESAQRIVTIAQTPRGEGGNLRVDTGFLRASGFAELGAINNPVRERPDGFLANGADPTEGQVALVLSGMELGETFYFSYSANYALIREAHDGWVKLAAQRWPQVVSAVAAEVRAKAG